MIRRTALWLLSSCFAFPIDFAQAAAPTDDAASTAFARLAAEMKPGTWRELKTEGLTDALLKAPLPSKGLDIMGWTDDAFFDDREDRIYFLGLRQRRRFIAYSAATNSWSDLGLPDHHLAAGSPPVESKFGHVYSRNAFDPQRGRFYHMDHNEGGGIYRFEIATQRWNKLPEGGNYAMTGIIEYFSARQGLVNLGSGRDGVRFFREADQAWENLGSVDVHGYHSLGRHNPLREEVLLAGGNDSPRTVVRVRKNERIERLNDSPVALNIRHDKLTVDPLSGRYLILLSDEKRLYEFDSNTNAYRLVDDFTETPWPFGRYDMPVAAFSQKHGVVVWVAHRMVLYKHDSGDGR